MLTAKQQRFIEAYSGNASEAARLAGYSAKSAYSTGQALLKHPEVSAAIRGREEKALAPLVADRQARERFWSRTMNDPEIDIGQRLRASELLARANGDFLERIQVDQRTEMMGVLFNPEEREKALDAIIARRRGAQ